MPVPATDLLSLDEAKRACRIGENDTEDEDLLIAYNSAAAEFLDDWVGPTVVRSVTTEVHDGLNRHQTGYRTAIVLRRRPVLSISLLTANGAVLAQTTDYLADPYPYDDSLFSGILRRMWGNVVGGWDYGTANVICSYSAGRVLQTSNVSPRFKRAAGIVLENLWRDREAGVEELGEFTLPRQSFPTFAMPRAAAQLLAREVGHAETFGIGG